MYPGAGQDWTDTAWLGTCRPPTAWGHGVCGLGRVDPTVRGDTGQVWGGGIGDGPFASLPLSPGWGENFLFVLLSPSMAHHHP